MTTDRLDRDAIRKRIDQARNQWRSQSVTTPASEPDPLADQPSVVASTEPELGFFFPETPAQPDRRFVTPVEDLTKRAATPGQRPSILQQVQQIPGALLDFIGLDDLSAPSLSGLAAGLSEEAAAQRSADLENQFGLTPGTLQRIADSRAMQTLNAVAETPGVDVLGVSGGGILTPAMRRIRGIGSPEEIDEAVRGIAGGVRGLLRRFSQRNRQVVLDAPPAGGKQIPVMFFDNANPEGALRTFDDTPEGRALIDQLEADVGARGGEVFWLSDNPDADEIAGVREIFSATQEPPDVPNGTIGATERVSAQPTQFTQPLPEDEEVARLQEELFGIEEQVADARRVVRPPKSSPLSFVSNDSLRAMAQQEGVDVTQPDWWDGLDSKVIRELREGLYQNPNIPTIRGLEAQRRQLRQQLIEAEEKAAEARRFAEGAPTPPQAVGPVPSSEGAIQFPLGGPQPPRSTGPVPTSAGAEQPAMIQPTPLGQNIIGLRPIQAGLSRSQELANIARRTVERLTFGRVRPVKDNPLAQAALAERQRVQPGIENQARRLGLVIGEQLRRVFQLDDKGRILSLAGIDPSIPGAPTIRDVAARLPLYQNALTPEQMAALEAVRQDVEQYRALLQEVGIEVSTRGDIMEGGFYLPRGRADVEGADVPVRVSSGRGSGGRRGFERPAVFASEAEGIEAGFEYAPIGEAVESFARDAGSRAADEHVASFFRNATDETGAPLGETPKMRLLRQNPEIANEMEALKRSLARLKALGGRLSERQSERIDEFLNSPVMDDPAIFDDILRGLNVRAARGPSAGQTATEIRQAIADVRGRIARLKPRYTQALHRAQAAPRDQGFIDLPGLQGRSFPLAIANAANKVLRDEGQTVGRLAPVVRTADALNNLYRGLNATGDNSAIGIQGALGLASDPKAYRAALSVNLRSFADDDVLGAFIVDFDGRARQAGAATSDMWARAQLRIGGSQTEFQLGQGLTSGISRLPVIRNLNRMFGNFGDALRLAWANDELLREMRKSGRSLREIEASGDLARIAKTVNRATGWSENRAFGSLGDLVLFAPRFLASRLQTLGNAMLSLRPGATLDQRIARRSMLKLIGWGTLLTFAINEMRGKETDVRPIVNGRPNPNFMRIRDVFGRDWSVFGTWDSLLRAIILTAMGKPHEAARGMGSGLTSMVWDLWTNQDFQGRPVRDNPAQFAQWLLRSFTPFIGEELPSAVGQTVRGVTQGEPGQIAGGAVTLTGEFTGAKSAPLSFLDVADEESQKLFNLRYDALEPYQKDIVQEADRVRKVADRRESTGYWAAIEDIDATRDKALSTIVTLRHQRQITPQEAVNLYFDAVTEARVSREQAARDFGVEFDEVAPETATTPNERALAEYYQVFDRSEVDGVFLSDLFTEQLRLLQKTWTPEQSRYVSRNTNRRDVPSEIMRLLRVYSPNTYRRIQESQEERQRHKRRRSSGTPPPTGVISIRDTVEGELAGAER